MPSFAYRDSELFYRESGAGRPLIIIPGNTASSACHAGELAHFGERYHAIAIDLPGTGGSGRMAVWPRDWWSAGAAAVIALLDRLGIDASALVGTSGGAAAAVLAALMAPGRVVAVVADSLVPHFPAAAVRAQVQARAERTPGQRAFWASAHGDDWAQVVDADTAMLAGYAGGGIDYFSERIGHVACPVLLTASLADPLLPGVVEQLSAMVQALPNGHLYLAAGGDHPLMWSRPAEFRMAADAFLKRFHPPLQEP